MRRAASAASVGVLLLALLGAPAVDACVLADPQSHTCCTMRTDPAVEGVGRSGCCGSPDDVPAAGSPAPMESAGEAASCGCVHAPAAPPAAAEAAAPAHQVPHDLLPALAALAAVRQDEPGRSRSRGGGDCRSSAALQPLYVLGCTFLI